MAQNDSHVAFGDAFSSRFLVLLDDDCGGQERALSLEAAHGDHVKQKSIADEAARVLHVGTDRKHAVNSFVMHVAEITEMLAANG